MRTDDVAGGCWSRSDYILLSNRSQIVSAGKGVAGLAVQRPEAPGDQTNLLPTSNPHPVTMPDQANQPRLPPVQLDWTDPHMPGPMVPGGMMRLTRSLTSGLTRRASDAPGVFWGVGDRGPNIKPGDAVERYGLDALRPLIGLDGARVMPLSETGPALARFRMTEDEIVLEAVFPLRAADGTTLTGIPPAPLPGMETEPAFTIDGEALPPSSFGADTEGIAALPDGRFWIADEYGPSLLLVDADGVVERRLVPIGGAAMFSGAPVQIGRASWRERV